ncbi:MAG: hypothetical protein VX733_12935 [Candidatus Latescibacterota bacterium]|nr:hypothetical protein [Candidatus Latescibacterota bacterium]
MMAALLLTLCLLTQAACDVSNPVRQREPGPSRIPTGELVLSTWLPAGLDEFRFSTQDQRILAEGGFTQIQWLQRAAVGDSTAEAVAMGFCNREGLGMPVYYEAPGFSSYDKLHNWAARTEVAPDFEAQVAARVAGLHERWLPSVGFAGYLIGHEDYRASTYPALARTVSAIRQQDSLRPAVTVGAIASYPRKVEFLDAFFQEGGVPNVFQHEHYVFRADVPDSGERLRDRVRALAQGYDEVALRLKERHGRWHAVIQVHAETRDGEIYYRLPNAGEIKLQAALALTRGASGLVYFLYSSGIEEVRNSLGEVVQLRTYTGLVDDAGAPTPAYATVQSLNRRLWRISDLLAPLYYHGSYPAGDPPEETFVTSSTSDLDIGLFGDREQPSLAIVVNRRPNVAQTARLQVTATLQDAESGVTMEVGKVIPVEIAAGSFRVLRVLSK